MLNRTEVASSDAIGANTPIMAWKIRIKGLGYLQTFPLRRGKPFLLESPLILTIFLPKIRVQHAQSFGVFLHMSYSFFNTRSGLSSPR